MGFSEVPSPSGSRWRSREDRVDLVSCGTWEEEVDPGMVWADSHPTHKGAVLVNLWERERQACLPGRRGVCTLKELTGRETGTLTNEVK